jgi:uncharacterized protein (DUF4415 family)
MKNALYSDAPKEIDEALESGEIVKDFIPSPDKLIFKAKKEKITIAIDTRSLEAFRGYAKKHNAKYQTMMNDVLGSYAEKYLNHK